MIEKIRPNGYLGHYSVGVRVALVALQAANSRLFEIRNSSSTKIIVPTRVDVRWIQTANHTAAIEDSLDLYKCTSFSAVDSANTVTPTPSVKRTPGMVATGDMAAVVRHVTITGAANGMTGGTLTKDTYPLAQLPKWLLAAVPTSDVPFSYAEMLKEHPDSHPLVLHNNEGFIIENRVVLGAAAGSTVYMDVSWAEYSTGG